MNSLKVQINARNNFHNRPAEGSRYIFVNYKNFHLDDDKNEGLKSYKNGDGTCTGSISFI